MEGSKDDPCIEGSLMIRQTNNDPHEYMFRDPTHVSRLALLLAQFSDGELCTIRSARLALNQEHILTATQAVAWRDWCQADGPALMAELDKLSEAALSLVIMRVMRPLVRRQLASR
jgi:hypothetical protein